MRGTRLRRVERRDIRDPEMHHLEGDRHHQQAKHPAPGVLGQRQPGAVMAADHALPAERTSPSVHQMLPDQQNIATGTTQLTTSNSTFSAFARGRSKCIRPISTKSK